MLTRRRFLILTGTAGVAVAGAAAGLTLLPGDGGSSDGLPVIRFGQESCRHCGMVIDDHRFAAAWMQPRGEELHFDDIACAIANAQEPPLEDGARCWVSDYETEQWLEASGAVYVRSSEIHSPMASGLIALPHRAAAKRVAGTVDGLVLDWHELPHHIETEGGHS